MRYKLICPNLKYIDHLSNPINSEYELCVMMKTIWCRETKSKSFQDLADKLNYESEEDYVYTNLNALSNLCSMFVLTVEDTMPNKFQMFLGYSSLLS